MKRRYTTPGESAPLGATLYKEGVNFSVFAPEAESVELLLFKNNNDTNPEKIFLNPLENKTYYYWHVFVPGLRENQLYGYRLYGEYNPTQGLYFDPSKVLVDPYAKMICGEYNRAMAAVYGASNLHHCLKSVVICNDFDWGNDIHPRHELSSSIVYELHVAGFTKNPNSGVDEKIRGTYTALIHKIPYLKSLGITAVELLPIFAFDPQDAPGKNLNYWGYSPINFFALHAPYAAEKEPQAIIHEFKRMVKAFHAHNIEVYLDVVYNHTTENDAYNEGPNLCFRGFANNSYYLMDEMGKYKNFSGTGNSLNANHSVVRRMILDSLRYWAKEMRIDGFRFDLASALSRDENGQAIKNPPVLWSIDSDPILAETKIIAEPWDAAGLYQVNDFSGDRWVIWNDSFRDTVKAFVAGRGNMVEKLMNKFMGSFGYMRMRHHIFKPEQSLNFVSSHDGFTMRDAVSYNKKNNWANGENNQDGHHDLYTWNCGIEGETDDETILNLRHQQQKNLFSILLLSQGTPMFWMGDELARSQQGNNNAYCQDNLLGWMNWDLIKKNITLLNFVKKLISVSRSYKIFSHQNYWQTQPSEIHPYVQFHGVKLNCPDVSANSHSLACELISPKQGEHLFLIMNMYWEPLNFELPSGEWELIFNTESDFNKKEFFEQSIKSPSRCVSLLSLKLGGY